MNGAPRLWVHFMYGPPAKWAFKQEPHLSDDETVAKMGHPDLDLGHPPIVIATKT